MTVRVHAGTAFDDLGGEANLRRFESAGPLKKAP
jgi:hypothetical protein